MRKDTRLRQITFSKGMDYMEDLVKAWIIMKIEEGCDR